MATTTTNPGIELSAPPVDQGASAWPREHSGISSSGAHSSANPASSRSADHRADRPTDRPANDPDDDSPDAPPKSPSQHNALQALLAFSALHEQVRRRKALAVKHRNFDGSVTVAEFEPPELFVLDEVLQLVAERAIAITGADGLAIALAENSEIVLRAAAGTVRPDVGARIDRDSAFSGACFQTAQIINCDDTETDPRVNLEACRKLGARSMIAVPLCGRRRVIGVLEAFSSWPFGFNDSDIGSLTLLAELVVGALKPEDEDRFAQSAQAASTKLEAKPPATSAPAEQIAPQIAAPIPAPIPAVKTEITPTVAAKPDFVTPAATKIVVTQSVATPAPITKPASAQPAAISAEILPAKPAAILDQPKVESKKAETTEAKTAEPKRSEPTTAPVSEASVATDTAEPLLTFGQPQPGGAKHRAAMLVALVCIVIAAALAGGIWWKLKTAQLGSVMVTENGQTEKNEPKSATEKDLTAAPVPAVPSADSVTAQSPDATSEASDSDNSPASAQEMSKFPRVTGIRHWSSADSSTVVLDLEDQVQYEEHQLANPERYYYDLRDTQLSPELVAKSIEVGDSFLARIRIAQPTAGMTRIVLETKGGAGVVHPEVSLEPNPYRLVIQVHKPGTDAKGTVNLFPNSPQAEKNKLAIVIPPPTKEDLQLRARVQKMRIVVDAGHGGWDLGTVGRRGLLEKDLVLEIAQRLGKLLESRLGADVILTRNDDNYIPLDQRAEIANQSQADLFVSVHANYSDLPSARGVETYYTNFFSAPGSKDPASKDAVSRNIGATNAGAPANGARSPVTPTLSATDLHERIEQSRRLAASVQRSLYGTLSAQNPGLRDRGIKEAGFVVLTESAMPGILAEVSFVSSPTDEQKLRSDGYREEIAEALYKGIAHYAASSKNTRLASAGK